MRVIVYPVLISLLCFQTDHPVSEWSLVNKSDEKKKQAKNINKISASTLK